MEGGSGECCWGGKGVEGVLGSSCLVEGENVGIGGLVVVVVVVGLEGGRDVVVLEEIGVFGVVMGVLCCIVMDLVLFVVYGVVLDFYWYIGL